MFLNDLINLDDGMQLNEKKLLNILNKKKGQKTTKTIVSFRFHVILPVIINELSFKKKLFKYFGMNAVNDAYASASLLKFR